nr:NADH dehydrogenase subunit 3 [Lepidoglyphus destructor]
MKVLLFVLFMAMIVLLLLALTYFLSYSKILSSHSKSSPFECGFLALSPFSPPFSVSFFIVSLMFLLFDVEILLVCLLPLVISFSYFSSSLMWFVLFLILVSTLYEWMKGVLVWV